MFSAIWEAFVSRSTQDEHDLRVLGLAIGQIREQQGVSVDELSVATGVLSARLRALEAGRVDPGYDLLLTLADGLGVRLSAFMIRVEEIEAEAQTQDE